jgi:hypothetical protein
VDFSTGLAGEALTHGQTYALSPGTPLTGPAGAPYGVLQSRTGSGSARPPGGCRGVAVLFLAFDLRVWLVVMGDRRSDLLV